MTIKVPSAFHGPLKKKMHYAKVGFMYLKITSLIIRERKVGFRRRCLGYIEKVMKGAKCSRDGDYTQKALEEYRVEFGYLLHFFMREEFEKIVREQRELQVRRSMGRDRAKKKPSASSIPSTSSAASSDQALTRARHQRQYDRRVNEIQMERQEGEDDRGKALDADLVVTESSRTESKNHDTNSRSERDTHSEDADIKPVNYKEPMAQVQMTGEYNVLANGQQHAEQPEFNTKGRVDQDAE
ncbi:hypothetical protein Tco_0060834 [Tanacetum coccineum]